MDNRLLNSRIASLVDSETYNSVGSSLGVECGFASISGKPNCIFAVSGGIGVTQGRIVANTIQMAIKAGVPVVGLWDSDGALVEEGIRVFEGYGLIMQSLAQASGIIPRLMAILGQNIGSAAVIPSLMDFVVAVRGVSQSYVNTPEVTKLVTGEVFDLNSMANADVLEQVIATAHMVTESEEQCFEKLQIILEYLPSNNIDEVKRREPSISLGIDKSISTKFDYDMLEAIVSIVDIGSFLPIQQNYGKSMLNGFARFDGQTVGIIANQSNFMGGCLDHEGLMKSSRFIKICNAFNMPIVTFINSQGYLPGINQELSGIARQAAKFFQAFNETTVPKISFIIGKAYGGAFLVMGNKWNGADLVYAWPNSQIAPTNIDAMVHLMYSNQFKHEDDPVAFRDKVTKKHRNEFASPKEAMSKGYIDQIINPEHTAVTIINGLYLLNGKRVANLGRKNSIMPI